VPTLGTIERPGFPAGPIEAVAKDPTYEEFATEDFTGRLRTTGFAGGFAFPGLC